MITTKRLKGSQIPGETSAEVVFVYDHRTGGGHYQMRINGRTSGARAQSAAEQEYYALVGQWLEVGAAEMIVGMPLGVVDDVCYTSESNSSIHKSKETK